MFESDLPVVLPHEKKLSVMEWIKEHIEPAKTCWWMSSYALKHAFENDESGFFITNG